MPSFRVTPLLPCPGCGAVSNPVDLEYQGSVVATIRSCPECLEAAKQLLDSVRPVFDAMITAGVSKELANETMTFLLDRHSPVR